MPREIRALRRNEIPVVIHQVSTVGDATQHVRHIKSPLDGMMVSLETLEYGPYLAQARWQHYGGSLPSPTGKMADRPGIMYWDDPEDLTQADKELLILKLKECLKQLEGE